MNEAIQNILARFRHKKVLLLGDGMLDVYMTGSANRICREAPVPIVDIAQVQAVAGGAANTAVNLAQLGAEVDYLSVIGDDREGEQLTQYLARQGVGIDSLLVDPARYTLTKQRVGVGDHLIVRFDSGSTDAIGKREEARLLATLRRRFPEVDAVVISDYGYGILTDRVIRELERLQAKHETLLVIDAKALDKYRTVHPTVAKPNYQELTTLLAITQPAAHGDRARQLEGYSEAALAATGARYVATTLDKEGALVFRSGKPPVRTYSKPVENSKAAGAGDTYVSALTLTLAAGASIEQAADIAQAAAMVILRRSGTSSCRLEELQSFLGYQGKYLPDWQELKRQVDRLRAEGKRIVFTNGCFDILHSGHVHYLRQAKAQGDILLVALNTDASIKRLKGPKRPVNNLDERVRIVAGLEAVDLVTSFPQNSPVELLKLIRPDVYVKGGDYRVEDLPEAPVVESLGGRVEILGFIAERSTTRLINQIQQTA